MVLEDQVGQKLHRSGYCGFLIVGREGSQNLIKAKKTAEVGVAPTVIARLVIIGRDRAVFVVEENETNEDGAEKERSNNNGVEFLEFSD